MIADKGDDSETFRSYLSKEKGYVPIIPRRKGNTKGNSEMDWGMYKHRHLVENAFARMKHFRAISTRYDKSERNYASMISLACLIMWLPMHR
jgi:transposase